ncbi:phenylalanine 4-monooxygenase [Taibaiella koreensis]|uniref:phenylalanine 4-monooxygenase n=1 Tax=Taibaiella koreensis TaxID=1268548 RepID=UPI000E59DF19|nr:phenylalanine 4-monooxygenase [Taibaiella koreensis]
MRNKPLEQVYSNYTEEDFEVWALLFRRQMDHLQQHASKLYLDAIDRIGFSAGKIPDFAETNKVLQAATGWQLCVAPELVPQDEFFRLLSQRIFPATCWLRTMAELDYLEEPDMFHDVFGHAPLLMEPAYATFMEAFGQLALQWLDHPGALEQLSAVYWFTVEFGLLREENEVKVFGAGILSSVGETRHALSDMPAKFSFDMRRMMQTGYRTDILQDKYFVIDSFAQLCRALPVLEASLKALSATVETFAVL